MQIMLTKHTLRVWFNVKNVIKTCAELAVLTLHKTWGLKLKQTANLHLFLLQRKAAGFEVFSAGSICVSSWLLDHCLIYKMCFYYTRLTAFLCRDHKVDVLFLFDWSLCLSADGLIKPLLCTSPCISLSRSFSLCLLTLSHSILLFEDQKDAVLPLIYSPHPHRPNSHHWLHLHTLLRPVMNKLRA